MKSIGCSDWIRGWGLGWNNNIGRLYKLENAWYKWIGTRQGRHNNKIQGKRSVTFKIKENGDFQFSSENKSNSLPDYRDVKEAIRILNVPDPVIIPRKQKTVFKNQLSLTF